MTATVMPAMRSDWNLLRLYFGSHLCAFVRGVHQHVNTMLPRACIEWCAAPVRLSYCRMGMNERHPCSRMLMKGRVRRRERVTCSGLRSSNIKYVDRRLF